MPALAHQIAGLKGPLHANSPLPSRAFQFGALYTNSCHGSQRVWAVLTQGVSSRIGEWFVNACAPSRVATTKGQFHDEQPRSGHAAGRRPQTRYRKASCAAGRPRGRPRGVFRPRPGRLCHPRSAEGASRDAAGLCRGQRHPRDRRFRCPVCRGRRLLPARGRDHDADGRFPVRHPRRRTDRSGRRHDRRNGAVPDRPHGAGRPAACQGRALSWRRWKTASARTRSVICSSCA